MSDTPVVLPTPHGAESIPAVLAAPRGRRKAAKPLVAAPASASDDSASLPTAAAPATILSEAPPMATPIENVAQNTGAKAEQMFGDMNERAKGAMEKGAAMFAELNSFNKGNVEALVESGKIAVAALQTMLLNRTMVTGVVEPPQGAHFTTCTPTYERDEKFQKAYATAAKDLDDWTAFEERVLSGSEQDYQDAVRAFAEESA